MKTNFKFNKDLRSIVVLILCLTLLVGIPIYWFFLVPPTLELQEIHQDSFTASGYFAPGGYFNITMDTGKESIQKLHNGKLNIIPNLTSTQKAKGITWNPMLFGIDQWPGSKEEIKYASNSPVNGEIILNVKRVDIPNQTELKGETIPLTIKYTVNYPYQTLSTELFGGTATKFDVKSETIFKTVNIKLGDKVISKSELDAISMNESWKKVVSAIIWAVAFFILLFFYSNFKVIESIKNESRKLGDSFFTKIKDLLRM